MDVMMVARAAWHGAFEAQGKHECVGYWVADLGMIVAGGGGGASMGCRGCGGASLCGYSRELGAILC